VRALAERFGLPVASKGESMDLCFVADGDYRRFLSTEQPEAFRPGPIRLPNGAVLGEHAGLPAYTIGQRKGLGVSWREPLYVIAKEAESNALIVGSRDALGRDRLHASDVNWIAGGPPEGPFRARVKIRYKAEAAQATVEPQGADAVLIRFDEPLPDITAGQGAVMYDGDRVIGGGVIGG
jgi:tRNA-specific 2-thiouridylase